MIKALLIIATVFFTVGEYSAQIEIQQDTLGPNIAGTIIDVNVDQFTPTPYYTKFYVTNNTGSDKSMYITRIKQSVPTTWTDYVCWPPQCYPSNGEVYSTPSSQSNPAPVLVNGTFRTVNGALAELGSQVYSDGNNAVALYMYYVTDLNGNYLDSVGVRINFVLNVEEKTKVQVSVAPNPANSYVKINSEGLTSGKLQIIDVLGNVVVSEEITGPTKIIQLSEFRNGVYFVRLESEKHKATTKKIIVKH